MKKLAALTLILILIFTMTGCKAVDVMKGLVSSDDEDIEMVRSDEEDLEVTSNANMRNTVLYYQNDMGYLVPVMRQIPWETGIAKAALSNMIDSTMIREDLSYIGLSPVLPAGTEINGMSISDSGLCKIDFTSEVTNYNSKQEEENFVKSVVYTLTEFETINEVVLMVDGKEVSTLPYGTDVSSPLRRENINPTDTALNSDSNVVVYYKGTSNGEYEYFVPVTVPTMAPTTDPYSALDVLFEGAPEGSGLYSDIPDGVHLQAVNVSEGIAYVDVYLENEDAVSEQITFDRMAKNIGLTLSQFSDIQNMELLIDGKTLEEAGLDLQNSDTVPVFANTY